MSLFWTQHAWVDGRFQTNVLLKADARGFWQSIQVNVQAPPEAKLWRGYVLPGMVNAHSHAFQRAMAGLSEQPSPHAGTAPDNFWSWRDQMYKVALSISPAQLEAVATQLYLEMLQGGYTQVCEFHYLHHAEDGAPYDDPLEMSWALVRAARKAGIGLTLLPVLYERASFDQPSLRQDQRRFASTANSVWQMHCAIKDKCSSNPGGLFSLVHAGIAIHSLRAASMASIQALHQMAAGRDIPIHIHIAEQTGEVDDCLSVNGMRPIEWLCSHVPLDSRWQLVHATHASSEEITSVASSGAGLVMCPTTEANLGDGLADMPSWLAAGVPLAIGSDSHASRDWREELRWLEYGQRLHLRQRNICANLFDKSIRGGARAAGHANWGLSVGARADAVVMSGQIPGLLGITQDRWLDAYVFACDASAVSDVYVAGRSVLKNRRHRQEQAIANNFVNNLKR